MKDLLVNVINDDGDNDIDRISFKKNRIYIRLMIIIFSIFASLSIIHLKPFHALAEERVANEQIDPSVEHFNKALGDYIERISQDSTMDADQKFNRYNGTMFSELGILTFFSLILGNAWLERKLDLAIQKENKRIMTLNEAISEHNLKYISDPGFETVEKREYLRSVKPLFGPYSLKIGKFFPEMAVAGSIVVILDAGINGYLIYEAEKKPVFFATFKLAGMATKDMVQFIQNQIHSFGNQLADPNSSVSQFIHRNSTEPGNN